MKKVQLQRHKVITKTNSFECFRLIAIIFLEIVDFCETCVATNPSDSKNVRSKIVFSTGCKNAKCVADLKVQSAVDARYDDYRLDLNPNRIKT